MRRGKKKGYLLEARSVGGEGKRPKGLQEEKAEDCSSYPFLLGKAYLLLIYNIYYIFNKSGNQYLTPTSATFASDTRIYAAHMPTQGLSCIRPPHWVDNHAEIYKKIKNLAEIYCLCFDETL